MLSRIFSSKLPAMVFMARASSDSSSVSGEARRLPRFPLANSWAPFLSSSTGRLILRLTKRLARPAARTVSNAAMIILFRTARMLLSMVATETAVRTTTRWPFFSITGRAIYIILLSRVELYRTESPLSPWRALLISGRFLWFSMVSARPTESPRTAPVESITVTRVSMLLPISLHNRSISATLIAPCSKAMANLLWISLALTVSSLSKFSRKKLLKWFVEYRVSTKRERRIIIKKDGKICQISLRLRGICYSLNLYPTPLTVSIKEAYCFNFCAVRQ